MEFRNKEPKTEISPVEKEDALVASSYCDVLRLTCEDIWTRVKYSNKGNTTQRESVQRLLSDIGQVSAVASLSFKMMESALFPGRLSFVTSEGKVFNTVGLTIPISAEGDFVWVDKTEHPESSQEEYALVAVHGSNYFRTALSQTHESDLHFVHSQLLPGQKPRFTAASESPYIIDERSLSLLSILSVSTDDTRPDGLDRFDFPSPRRRALRSSADELENLCEYIRNPHL
jgi:hypothetical protein